jgi:DNA-directed RNA polymerase subunit RPC12/RpoP
MTECYHCGQDLGDLEAEDLPRECPGCGSKLIKLVHAGGWHYFPRDYALRQEPKVSRETGTLIATLAGMGLLE